MPYQVFISYRRDGAEALACLISERLKQLGYRTFYDVDSLRSGKFNEEIFNVINSCTDVIVVLPPNGLERCTSPDDWVRKEIAHSIQAKKNIIPVMMRNFEFPDELPSDISELPNFNGISANMEYFEASFNKLLSMLESSNYSDEDRIKSLTSDEELISELSECIKALKFDNSATNKYNLANCYKKLRSSSLNEDIARLYMQAADLGYAPAQTELGYCYDYGVGVEKNIEKAFECFKRAADQGNSTAQYELARCFTYDSEEMALLWYKKAALMSEPNACLELAKHYEHKHHFNTAQKWYLKAADNGNAKAAKKINSKYWKIICGESVLSKILRFIVST